jgi:fructose-bisphosphate aldolase class II
MFDGSKFPLQENIDKTARIVELAHEASVSCEGEIGFVGYSDGAQSAGTKPSEAQKFGKETNVDAMAISVGNVHLQKNKEANLDLTRIREIEQVTATPLVIHGGSGVTTTQRSFLAQNSKICKFNIGTELRMAFGKALRKSLDTDPDQFDRVQILSQTYDPLVDATRKVLRAFKS